MTSSSPPCQMRTGSVRPYWPSTRRPKGSPRATTSNCRAVTPTPPSPPRSSTPSGRRWVRAVWACQGLTGQVGTLPPDLSYCISPTGAAAGAKAGPCAPGGAEQAAVQRAPAPTVCQPGQCGGALDPDQDGGEATHPPPNSEPRQATCQLRELGVVPVSRAQISWLWQT